MPAGWCRLLCRLGRFCLGSRLGSRPRCRSREISKEIITLPGGGPDWFNNAGSYYYFTSATTNAVALLLLVLQKVGSICASCVRVSSSTLHLCVAPIQAESFIRMRGVDAILAAFVTTLLLMSFYNTPQAPEFATRCLTLVQEHVFQGCFRVHCFLVSVCVLHKPPLLGWVPKHNFSVVHVFSTLPTTSPKFAQARWQPPCHLRKTLPLPGLRPRGH